eukprot:744647-Lingulodinium_polyedra.AAC.1
MSGHTSGNRASFGIRLCQRGPRLQHPLPVVRRGRQSATALGSRRRPRRRQGPRPARPWRRPC